MTETIVEALAAMASSQPDAIALKLPIGRRPNPPVSYKSVSYNELANDSRLIARGLRSYGVRKGQRVAVMVKPSLELFSLTFALFSLGAVPVLIDPGIGLKALKSCLAEARPKLFIGIPAAHLARLIFGWAKGSLTTTISVGSKGFWASTTLQKIRHLGDSDAEPEGERISARDDAAILFTSGSTGVPKGVVYKHQHFAAQVRMIRDLYDIQPGEVDLPTFPLFALFAPALGTTAVIPPMDFTRPAKVDPRVLADAIDNQGVTTMFGSPALLNTFSRWCAQESKTFGGFKRVISAGAPVPAQVLKRMREALPASADIVTPYGATECLPVASIESREVLDETAKLSATGYGVCVGRVAAPARVVIIETSDLAVSSESELELVSDGVIGEICVVSPAATESYFGRSTATEKAKVAMNDGQTLHRMGDLGWFDEQQRLWFCGRKSQRLQTANGDRHTVAIEGIFNAHPAVFRSALVGLGTPGKQRALLWVERELGQAISDANLSQELLALAAEHEQSSCVEKILFHRSFPVDIRHNAKIGREKLAILAAKAFA